MQASGRVSMERKRRMKIMIISESISTPSGFGMQTKMLAEGFVEAGHSVCVLSNTANPRKSNPEGLTEWVVPDIENRDILDRAIHQHAPDAVIVFWYTHMVSYMAGLRSAPANCPMFFWFPWEGSTVPADGKNLFFEMPPNRVAHLSEFARDLWSDVIDSDVVIPHGVDSNVFKPVAKSRKELLREWAVRLRFPLFEDAIIVLSMERNIRHKRWDATFDFVRRLSEKTGRTVQLIAHTKKVVKGAPNVLPGFDLPKLEEAYGLSNHVAYTDFDWSRGFTQDEMNELYAVCDLRISTSEGEGFGIGTVEAAFTQCLQVVNSHTTMPELLGADSKSLVSSAFTEFDRSSLWEVPNVSGMVDRAVDLLKPSQIDSRNQVTTEAYKHARAAFESSKVIKQWLELLESSQDDFTWYTHRWGFNAAYKTYVGWKNLVDFANKLVPGASLLEVGSFNGKFMDLAVQTSLRCTGLEMDDKALEHATQRAVASITQVKDFYEPWPAASILVWTDMLDIFFDGGGNDAVWDALDRVADYEWAFLRFDSAYRWSMPVFDSDLAVKYLESKGLARRLDIEELAKTEWDKPLQHQVWQKVRSSGDIPVSVLKPAK
jgi:glycosyltransferase involved in cell wall biosynthesis